MTPEKNCPHCGAAVTDEKCPYCGTLFYDFACLELNKPFYIKIRDSYSGKIVRARCTLKNMTFKEEYGTVNLYADNRRAYTCCSEKATREITLTFVNEPDDNGDLCWIVDQEIAGKTGTNWPSSKKH